MGAYERFKKAKAITQCFLACYNGESELLHSCIYDIMWAIDDYLEEIAFLQKH